MGRVWEAMGLSRLQNLEPKTPMQRYQREKPSEMIHVVSKQLARYEGNRRPDYRRPGSRLFPGADYEKDHMAIDGASRMPNVKVLPDEQNATTDGFRAWAVGWFLAQGIACRRVLSDSGSSYRFGEWRQACSAFDLKPIRTRPYTPRSNGTAGRFIKTLMGVWGCAIRSRPLNG